MHNLCIPGTVAIFFRRVVHAVSTLSTLSIAQQYHALQGNPKPELALGGESQPLHKAGENRLFSEEIAQKWINAWSRVGPLEEQLTRAVGISLPWLNSRWSLLPNKTDRMSGPATTHTEDNNTYRPPDANKSLPSTPGGQRQRDPDMNDDVIHQLMYNPALYDPIRKPRFPIVLCHGLYGFDVRGPSSVPFLQTHYWSNILTILRKKVGAEVIVTSVPSTGSIASRSAKLHEFLQVRAQGRGINLIGHSMGGLDCRHLISQIQPTDYAPLSLTTVGTPHRGSPFMDWCQDNIGLGKMDVKRAIDQTASEMPKISPTNDSSAFSRVAKPLLSLSSLPSSFTTLLLSILDSPAYANLTTKYLNEVFNPATPNLPDVKYFSVAGRVEGVSIWHPLWLPKLVLDGVERKVQQQSSIHPDGRNWGNDCLVSIESAKWGEFLGVLEGCDHWEMRGARGLDLNVDFSSVSMPSFARPLMKKADQEWSLKDWGSYVKLWKTEEVRTTMAESMKHSHSQVPSQSSIDEGDLDREKALKSSTDKVSAVLDWIVEQVPSTNKKDPQRDQKQRDLASKEGLERLYVALSRKLYDEGL